MGFQFGIIMNLEYKTTFYCFIAVIFFVVIFEYFTEIMEYFLNTSPIYSRMIQMIYKELMLMGLLTFGVIMFETDRKLSEEHHEYILGIDFTHVFLFFVTFFFVTHAFYLIFISMITKQNYYKTFIESIPDLIVKLESICDNKFRSWCYDYHIFPISSIRKNVEFHLIHSVFLKTYLLPSDFDFPFYLSACFDRIALKSVKRSIFSWILFILLIGANCLRIGWGFSCPNDDNHCKKSYLHSFLLCGIVLIGYTICLNLVTRVYKSRLIRRIEPLGIDNIQDCLTLLKNNEKSKEELNNIRVDATKLKEELEREFDILEEGEEEEEVVRYIADLLVLLSHWFVEFQSYCLVFMRVRIRSLLGYQRANVKSKTDIHRQKTILSSLKEDFPVIEDDSDDESADWEPLDGKIPTKVSEEKINYIPLKQRLKVSYHNKNIQIEKNINENLNKVKSELENFKSVKPSTFQIDDSYKNNAISIVERTDSKLDEINIEQYPKSTIINDNMSDNHLEKPDLTEITSKYSNDYFGIYCPSKKISPGVSSSSSEDSNDVFRNIFLFNNSSLFYRAIEFQIMCTCVYMALWSTNFLSIVSSTSFESVAAEGIYQLLMIVPILISFHLISYIAETYSLITGISELNTEVIYQVLVDMELMKKVSQELRDKIIEKVRKWTGEPNPDLFKQTEFVKALFNEIDLDGSGTVDRAEFRMMLRNLNLTFSDHRFALLFRAADNMGGDGYISEEEFERFIFPGVKLPTIMEIRRQSIMRKSIFKYITENNLNIDEIIANHDISNDPLLLRNSLIASHSLLNVQTVDKHTNSSSDDDKSLSSEDSLLDEDDQIAYKVDTSPIRHSLVTSHPILNVQTIGLLPNYDTNSSNDDDIPSLPSDDSLFDEDFNTVDNSQDMSLTPRHSLVQIIDLIPNNNGTANSNDNYDIPSLLSDDSMFDASEASYQEYSNF